ncbi:EAL domain-containing protein [Cohnella thailandensis]|uniref:EAL domain-containing protein n=1 Tax=Cohnella thailandensis TaxID=557557 RepID=A0A841SP53_9BACL|nr:EAL domain-containing protein [Cohnella thailandensis]MBP1976522.1 EAL domain-containing protein (putative c-di-GMP-specific phosphodiesterase class I) [Cohnella thailandensis]
MSIQNMLDRLLLGAKLLMTDRSLRIFPPDFTLRKPVQAMLDKHLERGDHCYLALFRWDCPESLLPQLKLLQSALQAETRRSMSALIRGQWDDSEVIGVDQFGPQEFVMLVKGEAPTHADFIPAALEYRLEALRLAVESRAASLREYRGRISMTGSYVPFAASSQAGMTNEELLRESYRFALALATRQLSPQVIAARRQLDLILDNRDISVLAQPIMNLKNGDVFGWEILTRGPAASIFHRPDELFQFASESKQLSRLEFMIVKLALEEVSLRQIREPVFLNVTAVTLNHPSFLSHVLECLKQLPGLSPKQIVFEITERHEVEDFATMLRILNSFRQHGFRFAVDDMGAGYSSLQWIGEMAPEMIKIDRSVIQFVDRFSVKESLLKAIVTAAGEMSCEVVAEGVEREEEADVLFRLNVGMGQGYYFARPNVLLHEHERHVFQETKERIQYRRDQVAS